MSPPGCGPKHVGQHERQDDQHHDTVCDLGLPDEVEQELIGIVGPHPVIGDAAQAFDPGHELLVRLQAEPLQHRRLLADRPSADRFVFRIDIIEGQHDLPDPERRNEWRDLDPCDQPSRYGANPGPDRKPARDSCERRQSVAEGELPHYD